MAKIATSLSGSIENHSMPISMEVSNECPVDVASVPVQNELGFLSSSHVVDFIANAPKCLVQFDVVMDSFSVFEMVFWMDDHNIVVRVLIK